MGGEAGGVGSASGPGGTGDGPEIGGEGVGVVETEAGGEGQKIRDREEEGVLEAPSPVDKQNFLEVRRVGRGKRCPDPGEL